MVSVGFRYMSERRWSELNHGNSSKVIRPTTRLIGLGCVDGPDVPRLPDWAYDGYI